MLENYACHNNIWFHPDTPSRVLRVLESLRNTDTRVIIWYGDGITGRVWGDVKIGYIRNSTGPKPISLCVWNNKALGGDAILTDCIVRIDTARGGRNLYIHPNLTLTRPYTCQKCHKTQVITPACPACN